MYKRSGYTYGKLGEIYKEIKESIKKDRETAGIIPRGLLFQSRGQQNTPTAF